MTAVSDKWLSQRQPPTGPQGAPGSGNGGSSLCLREQAVLTGGNAIATFTFDLTQIMADLGVPSTGRVAIAARAHLVGEYNANGNAPTPLSQLYPIILDITDDAITAALWNATFETATVPPGYLASLDSSFGDNALITAITPTGKSIDIVWTASPDGFVNLIPACELCAAALTGILV